MSKPFAIIVEAEIKPDRMDEFMTMIKNNAENSRKEPGCIRFGR
jgi:quinol monooxygenase YgiN